MKLSWKSIQKYQKGVCSKHNQRMKISYNVEDGYFKFKDDQIDRNSIEGLAIQTFIEKYNLSVQWIEEGGLWGSKDENGTFNGVIGRVPTSPVLFPSPQRPKYILRLVMEKQTWVFPSSATRQRDRQWWITPLVLVWTP